MENPAQSPLSSFPVKQGLKRFLNAAEYIFQHAVTSFVIMHLTDMLTHFCSLIGGVQAQLPALQTLLLKTAKGLSSLVSS